VLIGVSNRRVIVWGNSRRLVSGWASFAALRANFLIAVVFSLLRIFVLVHGVLVPRPSWAVTGVLHVGAERAVIPSNAELDGELALSW